MMLPQEIEVWYVLPAIRKELASNLVKLGSSQKDASKLLGVTEACISNYSKYKRADKVNFSHDMKEIIKSSAVRLKNKSSCPIKELEAVCLCFKNKGYLCTLHKKLDGRTCSMKGCI